MKKKIFIFLLALMFMIAVPLATYAALPSLIVCDGVKVPCGFKELVQLGINLMNYLIYLSTALAALSFCYAGFILLTSGGNEGKATEAKEVFRKTAIGFIWVLAAWLIISEIVGALLGPGYTLLKP